MFCYQVAQFAPISVPAKRAKIKKLYVINRESLKNLGKK